MGMLLVYTGYDVTMADSGVSAVSQLNRTVPDFVLGVRPERRTGFGARRCSRVQFSSLPARSNGNFSSGGLHDARLCHLLLHFAEGRLAERSLFFAGRHNNLIMTRADNARTVNLDQGGQILEDTSHQE
jgi:hypothetical protein